MAISSNPDPSRGLARLHEKCGNQFAATSKPIAMAKARYLAAGGLENIAGPGRVPRSKAAMTGASTGET